MQITARALRASLAAGFLVSLATGTTIAMAYGGDESPAVARKVPSTDEQPIRLAQSKKKRSEKSEEAHPAAPAETSSVATAPAQPEPDAWAVNCTNQTGPKLSCEMSQSIVEQKSRAQLMFISIKNASNNSAGAMLFRVFHGVYLPSGINVSVDKAQNAAIQFQKSDQYGAYAALPLDDKWLGELRKGKELKLAIQINQGEPLEISARLTGFGKAYDKIKTIE